MPSHHDRPLDKAVILDTEEDIATKVAVVCDTCGTELQVSEIREEPETAIVLEVAPCENCTQTAHHNGYLSGQDQGRGF